MAPQSIVFAAPVQRKSPDTRHTKQPLLNHNLGTVAWRIAAPPPNDGRRTLEVLATYQVFARYSDDPRNPSALNGQAQMLAFTETTSRFEIEEATSPHRPAIGASLRQRFDDLVVHEVRVVNHLPRGCEVHVLLDGTAIYSPQTLRPNGVFAEDIRSPLHVALISQHTFEGARLPEAEITLTQVPVREGHAIEVSGSIWMGYTLSHR